MSGLVYRLISLIYRELPGSRERKERFKDFVYGRMGLLFRGSPNYADWRRLKELRRKFPPAPLPAEPSQADWAALRARRAGSPAPAALRGDPYIVVPVYRDRRLTLACLYSVLSADPRAPLVVIDDRSPEADLAAKLEALAADGLFELLRNEKNIGFGHSANRGMELHPDRDVVLLNSDTEVYGDWLARLGRAVYSAPEVGTVTPLSNNAEICSYPHWLRDNEMALEVDYATLDGLAARVNRGRYASAPTGVGFCMYVRRACLDDVGLFDDRFAGGYGEENDFCLRARERGWEHRIAGDVFVRHVGSASFAGKTARRRRRALALMRERYPGYDADIQAYIRHAPLRQIQLNLDAARLLHAAPHANPRRSLLFLVHNWGGGIEHHVRDMQRWLEAEDVNVYFLRPHADPTHPSVSLSRPGVEVVPNVERILTNVERAQLVETLRLLGIDHLHVHHLGGFGDVGVEWTRRLAADLACPYDVTLHDFAPVCPRLHLNDREGYYCGEPAIAGCERCVAEQGSPFGYQPVWRWRDRWRPLLAGARRVHCPSRDVAERTRRHFPQAHYAVRPHREREYDAVPEPRARHPRERLRVAVPGAIGEQKGFDLLIACAEDARRRGLPIEYWVIGYTMDDARARQAGVEISGPYESEQADEQLAAAGCHLAFLPSVSPETYSFTLSSALRARLYPVVFDLGALAERLTDLGWGEILPWSLVGDPGRINDALLAVRVTPAPARLSTPWAASRYSSLVKDFYEDFGP